MEIRHYQPSDLAQIIGSRLTGWLPRPVYRVLQLRDASV